MNNKSLIGSSGLKDLFYALNSWRMAGVPVFHLPINAVSVNGFHAVVCQDLLVIFIFDLL